jgi:hypothetical protein
MAGLPFRSAEGGVAVALRVTPNAARDAIEGVETRPGAGPQLRIRVRAVPDKGKANRAVIALLAEAWDLPLGTLSIVTGETARDKMLHVAGPPDRLRSALTNWFEAHRS